MDIALAFLASILLGFIPMFFFAAVIYWTDRYEKEPMLLLVAVFGWGALIAAAGAFFLNTFLGLSVYALTGSELATGFTTTSFIAPIVEEILKGFAVFLIFLLFRQEFDSVLDGIVYAAVTALGFAATENAFYIFNFGYVEGGYAGIAEMVFIRIFLVGWQHPFYTAFIGIGLAFSRLSSKPVVKVFAPIVGLSLAIYGHSLHNTLASLLNGTSGLLTAAVIDWTGWGAMLLFIIWAIYRERCWISEHLKEEVSLGIISAKQYQTACSALAQSSARLTALLSGRFKATSRFYQLTAELAHKKQQHITLGDENRNQAFIERLRAELTSLAPLVPS
ncbi:MAG: protease PrsW [Chloroflexi bacterium]|nr:MAG: protease PrsW [Chloroflexota bacterium]